MGYRAPRMSFWTVAPPPPLLPRCRHPYRRRMRKRGERVAVAAAAAAVAAVVVALRLVGEAGKEEEGVRV